MMLRVAILWGGGLGDLLVLRSFVQALHSRGNINTYIMTTASHLQGLHKEISPEVNFVHLPTRLKALISTIMQYRGKFDLIYLGPYPRWKTRLLGKVIAGRSPVLARRHADVSPFLLEQIQAEIKKLGLQSPLMRKFPYGALPWKPTLSTGRITPFIVMHPSSKDRWETTRWPLIRWKALVLRILKNTELSIYFVGVVSEENMLRDLVQDLPSEAKDRISLFIAKPLREVCSLITSSSGVICHNSGILHLATLLKKQTVCLTGSSAKQWQPPYPWVKNVSSEACSLACNQYRCPIPFFNAKCIRKLSVEKVWREVQNLLFEIK